MESSTSAAGYSTTQNQRPPPSTSGLMSSAKVIAGAAKSAMSHDSDKVDKGRVAGATADLLGAAKHYGKLEEKSFGKYVNKAEGYLQNYQASHSSGGAASAAAGAAYQGQQEAHYAQPSTTSGGAGVSQGSSGGSGYGDYIKLAQGLLKKH